MYALWLRQDPCARIQMLDTSVSRPKNDPVLLLFFKPDSSHIWKLHKKYVAEQLYLLFVLFAHIRIHF